MRSTRLSRVEILLARGLTGGGSSDFDFGFRAAPRRPLREAAVLLALDPAQEALILTRRASFLRAHPGQIALPGGRREPSDPSLEATALREAQEEIGLAPEAVRLLGRLPVHETVSGFAMQPVVGVLTGPVRLQADPSEVDEIFTVPLEIVLDPSRYRLEERRWAGGRGAYYVVPFGPYYIWGATARVLHTLALEAQK